jgi:hypothetical protein
LPLNHREKRHMSTVTYYGAQAFEITKKGRFVAGQPLQATSAEHALLRAEKLAQSRGGAIAFRNVVDGETEQCDAVILGCFGRVPDDVA